MSVKTGVFGRGKDYVDISVIQGFKFTKKTAKFYEKCVEWSRRFNKITEGGVSVLFWQVHPAFSHIASVWWRGKKVAMFFLDRDTGIISGRPIERTTNNTDVNDRNVWDEVLREGWENAISKDLQPLKNQMDRAKNAQWSEVDISD